MPPGGARSARTIGQGPGLLEERARAGYHPAPGRMAGERAAAARVSTRPRGRKARARATERRRLDYSSDVFLLRPLRFPLRSLGFTFTADLMSGLTFTPFFTPLSLGMKRI